LTEISVEIKESIDRLYFHQSQGIGASASSRVRLGTVRIRVLGGEQTQAEGSTRHSKVALHGAQPRQPRGGQDTKEWVATNMGLLVSALKSSLACSYSVVSRKCRGCGDSSGMRSCNSFDRTSPADRKESQN